MPSREWKGKWFYSLFGNGTAVFNRTFWQILKKSQSESKKQIAVKKQPAPPTRDSTQNKWSIQSCVFVTYYTSLNLSLQDILHEYFNYSVSSPSALLCPRPPPSFLSLSLQSDETTVSKCSERSRQLGGVARGRGQFEEASRAAAARRR